MIKRFKAWMAANKGPSAKEQAADLEAKLTLRRIMKLDVDDPERQRIIDDFRKKKRIGD